MADPHAILLVCVPGSPLLADGPALKLPVGMQWIVSRRGTPPVVKTDEWDALPLWWDGALVPEGWDRARRHYAGSVDQEADTLSDFDRLLLLFAPTADVVLRLARAIVTAGLAERVVCLDADGREVAP